MSLRKNNFPGFRRKYTSAPATGAARHEFSRQALILFGVAFDASFLNPVNHELHPILPPAAGRRIFCHFDFDRFRR
jgi:hypothetical protein